ncbi:MAG: LamG-like jellyroll fold domain-containing protein, partial [Spirosomataceae bacterium]
MLKKLLFLITFGLPMLLVGQSTITFNGTDNKISVPKNGTGVLNNFNTPHDFTVEIRFKFNGTPNGTIFSKHGPPADGFFIEMNGTNIHAGMGYGGNYSTITGSSLSANQYYHAALSYEASSNSFKLYVDGALVGTKVIEGTYVPNVDDYISIGSSDHWGGYANLTLDYFRIWNVQKNGTDISSNKDIEVECSSPNLVLQYKFDNGTTINDCSPNAHTGIFFGSTLSTGLSPGNGLHFDGNDDFIQTSYNPNLDVSAGGELTLEAWVMPSSSGNVMLRGNYGYGLWIEVNGSSARPWFWDQSTFTSAIKTNSYPMVSNRWNHVAVTVKDLGSSLSIHFYVNGVPDPNNPYTSNQSAIQDGGSNAGLFIGQQGSGCYCNRFGGRLDELRIWKKVRTASQISENTFKEVIASNEADLVAYYSFEAGTPNSSNSTVTQLEDKVNSLNNGTLTNFALTGSTSNWVESYAMVVPATQAASSTTATGFTANWSAPAVGTVTNYVLDVSTSSTFNSFVSGYNGLVVNGTSQAVTGLSSNTTYYYRVRADKTSVTGQGGFSSTQTVSTLASSNANLSSLSISSGTLSPTFSSGTTTYTAFVPNSTESITVTPTREEANATIQVRINGGTYTAVTSGSSSGSLNLNVGSNTVDVLVTAQNGTTVKTYTIEICKFPTAPTASAQSFCGAATVSNLVATGTAIKWYSVATDGTALASTTALVTATYYASQMVNSCESTRTTVNVTINPVTSAPTFTTTYTPLSLSGFNADVVANGTSVTASTTHDFDGGGAYLLASDFTQYGIPSSFLPNGGSFTSLNTANLPYQLASYSANNSLRLTNGQAGTLTLNNSTKARSIAILGASGNGNAIATFTVVFTDNTTQQFANQTIYDWFSNPNFAIKGIGRIDANTLDPTTGSENPRLYETILEIDPSNYGKTIGSITVACTSGPGILNIMGATSSFVSTINTTFCNAATVADLGMKTATGSVTWYADNTTTTPMAATDALATGTYYVSQTVNGCESARTAVNVTVNVSTAPTASAQSFCGTATVSNLVATGTAIKWYSAATGGTALAATTALATGTYYASQTMNGCESARTSVSVIVNSVPTAPTAASPQVYAGSSTIGNLIATGTAIQWYSAATGGTALAATTEVTDGATYYSSQIVNGCESTRTAVTLRKISEASQTSCSPATVATLVSTPSSGATARWFTSATGGTALASTETVNTGIYYVEQENLASTIPLGSGFSQPFGVAVQSDGKIIVADNRNDDIKRMNADGSNIITLGSGFNRPAAVTVQSDGKILVADYGNGVVKRMDADGSNIVTLGFGFVLPIGVAVQADGKILVADYNDIKRMDADGNNIVTLGSGFNQPAGVAVQSDGKIIVADNRNNAIKRMNADGSNIVTLGSGFTLPFAVAIQSDGKILVADYSNNAIKRMDADGNNITLLGSGFRNPTGVVVQSDGKILVADNGNNAIKRISSAFSNRVAVNITVNVPTAPTASAQSFCGTATVANLVATGTAIQWYSAATGGTALASTAALATGTYYASQTVNGCESTRTSVSVTINEIPTAPTASAQSFCGTTSTIANLVATGSNIQWYSAATGGTALASTAALATGTYY